MSTAAVSMLKTTVRPGAHAAAPAGTYALVGGTTAVFADIQRAVNHDYLVVFPTAALIILLILALLLRSVVAPWYLMASVGLGFAATLGATGLAAAGAEGTEEGLRAALARRAAEPWYPAAYAALEKIMAGESSIEIFRASRPFYYGHWDEAAQAHATVGISERHQAAREGFFADGAIDPPATRAALKKLTAPVLTRHVHTRRRNSRRDLIHRCRPRSGHYQRHSRTVRHSIFLHYLLLRRCAHPVRWPDFL